MNIAFFGSSLVSAYWNGAATYYRGLIRALATRGHRVAFFEPDAFDRQAHRDMADPQWAQVVVFEPTPAAMEAALATAAREADVVVKCSGVGVLDAELEEAVASLSGPHRSAVLWDVDAPATLESVHGNSADPLRRLIPRYDAVFTYGGGERVVSAYTALGARRCVPIYNAVDPGTHYRVPARRAYEGDLAFLGNRLPDRERRVEEFFLAVAEDLPARRFVLGGSGWADKPKPANVRYVGHVYTRDHNAFNCSPRAVLNINRDSMARWGASPPTRIFEAAGAGACIITDRWDGIEAFLDPGHEVLVARGGAEVARQLGALDPRQAHGIGAAARRRVLAEHTYAHRAVQVEAILDGRENWRKAG